MVETACRDKWTDSSLDALNHQVDRRLRHLDQDIRKARIDAASLAEEMNVRFNCPRRVRYAIPRPKNLRNRQSRGPEITAELSWGESWTDERIDDLRSLVSASATQYDIALAELGDEARHLSSDLVVRFAPMGRRRRFRRNDSRCPAIQAHHRIRTSSALTATPSRGPWTDGRIDDFNHNADVGLGRFELEVSECQTEVEDLRTEMQNRLQARRHARIYLYCGGFLATYFAILLCAKLLGAS